MVHGGFQPAGGFKLPDVHRAVKGDVARSGCFTGSSRFTEVRYCI